MSAKCWLAAATVLIALSNVGPAWAEAPVAAGWWYRLQSGLSPVAIPPPPDAPEDGLYVALDPSGPLAESAVSYASSSTDGGTLTLTFASAPSGTPSIDACVATAAISGAQGGAWEAKPGYDCDAGRAEGALAPDGSSIVFTLSSAFATGSETIDAVLIPTGSAPFTAPIEKPDEASFAPIAPTTTDGEGGFIPDPGTSFDADPGTSFGDGAFGDVPLTPGETLGGSPPVPDASPTEPEGVATDGGRPAPGGAGPVADVAVDQFPKIVAVGLLGLLGAAYWYLSNRAEPAPRLIGGLTARKGAAPPDAAVNVAPALMTPTGSSPRVAHPVGGLGRFARPREKLPNKL